MEVEVKEEEEEEEEEEQKQIGQLEPESWQQEMRLQCPKAVLECHKLRCRQSGKARGAWQSGTHFGSFWVQCNVQQEWRNGAEDTDGGREGCRLRYVFGSKLNFCQRRKKLQIFVLRTALMRHRKRRAISPAESWVLLLPHSRICSVATGSLYACVCVCVFSVCVFRVCVCVQLAVLVSGEMANGQEPNWYEPS